MYLLDTNTLIYFFKGMGKVADTLLSKSPKDIAIPSITLFELEVGIAKSVNPKKRKQQLDSLLSLLTIVPLGANEAKSAAKIRTDLENQGKPIGPYDTLIAGIAKSANYILVTRNSKEFSRVKGLKIADWY